jgi:hypothetical protein
VKARSAAQTRTLTRSENRVAGAEALTDYSKAGAEWPFAEASAIYNADPGGLRKAARSRYYLLVVCSACSRPELPTGSDGAGAFADPAQ